MTQPLDWNRIMELSTKGNLTPPRRVEKSLAQWQAVLPADVFHVTRNRGTERPFSSDACSRQAEGKYACACCAEPLFDSTSKFESGTGWPSFTAPVMPNVVAYTHDMGHGMSRIEATCAVCDAHLGHVFPDGPGGTLRYCVNGIALTKVG